MRNTLLSVALAMLALATSQGARPETTELVNIAPIRDIVMTEGGFELEKSEEIAEAIAYGSEKAGVHPSVILGMIYVESTFRPKVISGDGAVGIMQVMPATARRVAKDHGLPEPTKTSLQDPEANILIGSLYLGSWKQQGLDDRTAVAAYNCGRIINIVEKPNHQSAIYSAKVLRRAKIYETKMGGG